MFQSKKANFLIIIVMLGVIAAFAYSYNHSVTRAVIDVAYNDRASLQSYNTEIIGRLTGQESSDSWSEIIEQYRDIVIVIENSENEVVARSEGRRWSALDVKVQTPFEYKGKAFVIKSSVYLLRDYVSDTRALIKFFFIESLISISAFFLLVLIIYTIILRPFRNLYKAIEEYDKTGKLKDIRIKGYAGEVYKRFVSMTGNLEAQQNKQRRIMASISHDIKTPLTSIMGYAERLSKGGLSEEREQRYLDTVREKSEEIRSLIDEFDDYLSLNMLGEFKKANITVKQLCEYIEADYRDEIENSGAVFNLKLYGDEDAATFLDLAKFRRVMGNVFSNSLKHFCSEHRYIELEIFSDKEKIYINIEDSGEGVQNDKLELIFEPLYTSDEGRKVAGLGLAICREIIEGHSGKIYAEESRFGGLKICIELERLSKKAAKK